MFIDLLRRSLVFAIIFICMLVANLLADVLGGKGYWSTHGWPAACALMAAGVIIWGFSIYYSSHPPRTWVDEETGQRVVIRNQRHLFYIPMKYWTLICFGLAGLILVTRWSPGQR